MVYLPHAVAFLLTLVIGLYLFQPFTNRVLGTISLAVSSVLLLGISSYVFFLAFPPSDALGIHPNFQDGINEVLVRIVSLLVAGFTTAYGIKARFWGAYEEPLRQ